MTDPQPEPFRWAVLEGYRDGTTWTHHYHSEIEATRAQRRMADRNPFREYEVVPVASCGEL